jgi:ankyrin repeat protein
MNSPVRLGATCIAVLLLLPGCGYSLLRAAGEGDTAAVRALLDQGMDANASFPVIGTHPLILAAAGGHVETVCALLDRGAKVTTTDLTGWTALHAAAYRGHAEVVRVLVERGAVMERTTWAMPEPLVWAEKQGHTEVVSVLKEAEANKLATKIPSEAGGEGIGIGRPRSICSQLDQSSRKAGPPGS